MYFTSEINEINTLLLSVYDVMSISRIYIYIYTYTLHIAQNTWAFWVENSTGETGKYLLA